jgi:hypothetical protein
MIEDSRTDQEVRVKTRGRRSELYGPAVLTVVTLVIALITSFASFFIGQWLLRGTADVIRAAFGLLLLLAKALPSAWYADLARWLPGGDAVILLVVGALLLRRRDA